MSQEDHTAINGVTKAVDKASHDLGEQARNLIRIAFWTVVIMVVVLVAATVLLNRIDGNTDRNANAIARLDEHLTEVDTSVDRLERFVEDLETVTPNEQARDDAITAAVNEVPAIKSILCEAFPTATACQGEP